MLDLPITYPHCPFTCPQPWYDMYDPDSLPPMRPADLEGKPLFHRLIRQYRQLDKLDDKTFRKLRAVYLGMISYVDHMLGRLLDALDETGLANETAVFFFSDHGEWAGDYGLVEKWHGGLDDCLTHIPMIVRVPGGAPGHVVREPVERCFGTWKDACWRGISIPATWFRSSARRGDFRKTEFPRTPAAYQRSASRSSRTDRFSFRARLHRSLMRE